MAYSISHDIPKCKWPQHWWEYVCIGWGRMLVFWFFTIAYYSDFDYAMLPWFEVKVGSNQETERFAASVKMGKLLVTVENNLFMFKKASL